MSHERLYRYRWVFVVGVTSISLLYYGFFIGPMLEDATNIRAFRFFDYPIQLISFYWTNYEDGFGLGEYWYPELLGLRSRQSYWHNSITWDYLSMILILPIVMVIASILFLQPTLNKTELPARRPFGVWPTAAGACGFGVIGMSVICIILGHENRFEEFEELSFHSLNGTLFYLDKMTPIPFAIITTVLSFISFGIVYLFQKRRVQFWWLERLSFWLLACSLTVTCWCTFYLWWIRSDWYMWDFKRAYYNALFLSCSVLIWAWVNRLVLLFSLQRYLQAAAENPDSICLGCGYDLRGSLQSKTCPECGLGIPERLKHLSTEQLNLSDG